MSTVERSPDQQASAPTAPLLTLFLVPMLIVVLLVVAIGGGTSWLIVAGTIAAIVVMVGLVMVALGRMMADSD
jgi:hypothetical protein